MCHRINPISGLYPASPRTDWGDRWTSKHPYKCLPMRMASSYGWELRCPETIHVTWNGGQHPDDVQVRNVMGQKVVWAEGHFGGGILTFLTGYIFRTEKDWGLWSMGKPNDCKPGITALSGINETDWLPFSFTMNWKFDENFPSKKKGGSVTFKAGDCFCFIFPVRLNDIDDVQPIIADLEEDPELMEEYKLYSYNRDKVNMIIQKQNEFDDMKAKSELAGCPVYAKRPENKKGSQMHYMRGKKVKGERGKFNHKTKLRVKPPIYSDTVKARNQA